jgi:hypothetical protein
MIFFFIFFTRHFKNGLQLIQCEHGEKPREEQKQGEENSNRTNKDSNVDPGGVKHRPT